MTRRKKQVYALCGTAVVGDQASEERFAERRSRWQQGLEATCEDFLHEAKAEGQKSQKRNIRAGGFASGCVSNTKSRQVGPRVFSYKLCIRSLAWFALPRGPPVFRGRQREPFSESWMR
jgi:hypothetical protein